MSNIENALNSIIEAEGHTYVPEASLRRMMRLKPNDKITGMDSLIRAGNIKVVAKGNNYYFSTAEIDRFENEIADNVKRILRAKVDKVPEETIERYISEFDSKSTLDPMQRKAILKAVNSPFFILTGGPGTGKTYTLNGIDYVLRKALGVSISYTAPTGKAARRIKEATGNDATTLHKKIGYYQRNAVTKYVSEDVLIVDESSMLDNEIAAATLKTIFSGNRIILVGDVDQLPSVGAGAVLRDLIASGVIPTVKLTKTFRQKGESLILDNMKNIRDGIQKLDSSKEKAFIITRPDETRLTPTDWMLYAFIHQVNRFGIDNVALLTPYRRMQYKTGAEYMNLLIQSKVNPDNKGIKCGAVEYRLNDRVMQLENRAECANGDVGEIVDVMPYGVTVQYVDGTVNYSNGELRQLALAYAMSVHKSQGSEYKAVISCLLNEHKMMLQRNLLYTAVTRAKEEFSILCEDNAVRTAIANEASSKRITMLQERLKR